MSTTTGALTEMKIESAGKVLRTINGPITTTYQYDDCDRLITQTDARKGDTEFVYFANSALLSAMIDPADLAASRITEVYQYNAAGRRIATTDAKNQTRRVEYDLHGRVVREWGSASYPVERSYCSCGKIVELRSYRGGTGWSGATWPAATTGAYDRTTWTYGSATGLLLAKTDANSMSVTYAYDAAGRMSSRTWARGVVTNYGYDPATGQLLSTTYSDGTPAVTYTYDRRGRIATVVDGVGSRTLTYTAYDQLSNEALILTGFGSGSIAYTHDVYGRRTQSLPMMHPTGSTAFGQGVNYGYAAGTGLLSSVSGPATFTYSYLANSGLPASIGGSDTKELTWAAHRDDLVSYDNRYSGGSFSAHRFEYTRDEISRIVIETQYKEDSLFSGIPFSYNPRSELTSGPGSVVSYDEQGNRVTGNGAAYQANALNQYTAVGGSTWTHDADGNLLSNGTQTNVYDAENRLVQVTKGSMVYSFAYDYRHRLVKYTGYWQPWPGYGYSVAGTSWRLYDGDRVALRYDTVGGYTQTAQYLWGRDLAGRHASGDGTGGLLVVWSNGIGYLPHYDGRGNIWGFSGGYSRSLSAFGEVAFYPSGLPANMPIGLLTYAHGTKEYFSDLGLYNYGRRFYDPKSGRFIGRDPIQENGGINLYAFVRNNPANRWDYLGMKYGDTYIDDKRIPFGHYDVGDGAHACPYGYAWDGLYTCYKDESAPKGPRSGAVEMPVFDVNESRIPPLDSALGSRLSFPGLSPSFDSGLSIPDWDGTLPSRSRSDGKDHGNDCDGLMRKYGNLISATPGQRFSTAREAALAMAVQLVLQSIDKRIEYSSGVIVEGVFDDLAPGKGISYTFSPIHTDKSHDGVNATNEAIYNRAWNSGEGIYGGRVIIHGHTHPIDGGDRFSLYDLQIYHNTIDGQFVDSGVFGVLITPNKGILFYDPRLTVDNVENRRGSDGSTLGESPSPTELIGIIDCFGKK
ncbi:MAG: RHS repeat-associated core domain-containing protein [Opitutaceae bacterium]|nr:RHS repeat-associated core domain-containing protein [Opitutaceae bacterium]